MAALTKQEINLPTLSLEPIMLYSAMDTREIRYPGCFSTKR